MQGNARGMQGNAKKVLIFAEAILLKWDERIKCTKNKKQISAILKFVFSA